MKRVHMRPQRVLPWRRRALAEPARLAWLEAARVASTPIVYLATDENTPLMPGYYGYQPSGSPQ